MAAERGGDVGGLFDKTMDAVWLASAMGSVLERGPLGVFDADDPAARVLASYGLLQPDSSGLVAAPAFVDAVRGRESAFAAGIRSTLGQAATVAFSGGAPGGWSRFSHEVLAAQAEASAMFGPLLARFVIPSLDGLADRFADGGRFLDVGVGGAGLACAFCEALPSARVVGIDVLPSALELAAKAAADRGLSDRLELRNQGVEALTDTEAFDLAWLPLPFIPRAAATEGIGRVRSALAPGGWLLLPGSVDDGGAAGAIAQWQTHIAGGTLLDRNERDRLLMDAGFQSLRDLPVPPGAPPVLAGQRLS